MPVSAKDVFQGKPMVVMLLELPEGTYGELLKTYENSLNLGKHNLTMEQWSGGIFCEGVRSLFFQQQVKDTCRADDWYITWLKARIKRDELTLKTSDMFFDQKAAAKDCETSISIYKEVLQKYLEYGRL